MEDFIILFVSFIIILGFINLYKTSTSKVKYVQSDLYNGRSNEYLVRYSDGTLPNKKNNSLAGANALAYMRENLIILVEEVKKKHCGNDLKCEINSEEEKELNNQYISIKEIKMLINRFNPDNISESTPDNKYTSYSINKGEKIVFCIRDKKNNKIIDINTLMFVAIHELAHVMTISIGHGDDFWNNMRYLLSIAINTDTNKDYNTTSDFYKNNINTSHTKIYYYNNYAEPEPYCGTNITTTPCKDAMCSDPIKH